MLCNLRNRSSLIFKNTIYRQGSIVSLKYYSTIDDKIESDAIKEEIGEVETERTETESKQFWDIKPQKRTPETPKSVKNTTEHVSSEAKQFSALLEELFNRSHKLSAPKEPVKESSDIMIEKKLLDLVTRDRKPYKAKAPLPRSMLGSVYGKAKQERKQEVDAIFDILDTKGSMNWDIKNVVQNENIQLKQREMTSIQAVVECKSDIELLDKMQLEIDQPEYPSYYPKVVVKAIEHASKKDPYLALTLFEMVKHKSIHSYIFGCTTQVYNTLLLLRWNAWSDIYGMLDLMEEMTVNGIEFDNHSRRIVRDVVHEIESEGKTSLFWNPDEKRSCNIMKEMAGKWLITK